MWEDIAWFPLNRLLRHCTTWDLQYYPGVIKARFVLWLGTKGQMLIISFMHNCRIIKTLEVNFFFADVEDHNFGKTK